MYHTPREAEVAQGAGRRRLQIIPHNPQAALMLPPGLCLLQASGCVRDARGYVGFLAITWGLRILVSAPCTAERRLLASDMFCLSCLMTN